MSAPATPLSANEIRFYFTRAAVGAGAPFGIGEDLAASALWLAALGLDPALVAAPPLAALRDGTSTRRIAWDMTTSTLEPNDTTDMPLSALFAGPAAADRVGMVAAGSAGEVIVDRVDCAVLVLASVAVARPVGQGVRVKWTTDRGITITVHLGDDGVSIDGSLAPELTQVQPARMVLTLMTGDLSKGHALIDLDQGYRHLFEHGVDVAGEAWDVVHACFRKCLVPSSASSRLEGAGAGLTDND